MVPRLLFHLDRSDIPLGLPAGAKETGVSPIFRAKVCGEDRN